MPKRKKGTKPAVANKKKPEQEVNPTSLHPPTPPTPPTPETFPNEIFTSILSHLRDDKPTLARCMRVSSSFKAMAGPLLYEVMEWEDMKKNPLQVVNVGKALRGRTVKWITINTEVRRIKQINFEFHHHKDCPKPGRPIRQRPIPVPIMTITMSNYENSSRNLFYGYCRRCPLMLDISPKKVVFKLDKNTEEYEFLPEYSTTAPVEDLVVCFNLRRAPEQYIYLKGQAKRLVVILSLSNYNNHRPNFSTGTSDEPLAHDMTRLAEAIVEYIEDRQSASEILLVNFTRSYEDLSVDAKTLFEPAFVNGLQRTRDRIATWGSRYTPYFRSSAELALVTRRFITMRDYLTNHDFGGVYTRTEVDRMLKEDVEE